MTKHVTPLSIPDSSVLHHPYTGSDTARTLLRFFDLAAAQTARADLDTLDGAVDLSAHLDEIGTELALGLVVGMADAMADLALLTANFTLA